MDANGRRKTITAGTFAIESKSMSNPHPISAVETLNRQLPLQGAEDTDAIHHPLRPAFVSNPHFPCPGPCRPTQFGY